ncbi:diguanylate cyclase [Pseudomonas sp. CCI3.2]|uniref:diguanylate cyclase n=3 Tax=Pseudomonas TaxID=286 RepID=UPI002AC95792|nr:MULTISPECIES: diguanylate cyclase [unclassified Pseudomonas]MEB0076070.1 diguanylate cyclase [Pseudomonas sp. MH10out]MEB0090824.1 diguanylate cyclase [Pseudomonas sp. CCI4.2]MEB0100129.1 diguanylate cyclase [Pseudomonas sp. CCI3.2]MEB0156176.1 diguanylate cyclase [Pseudomonas sp. AH2 (2023)]MEB0166267.1 diguanylate cyclase [Pseudomonas sp. CCC4.4]
MTSSFGARNRNQAFAKRALMPRAIGLAAGFFCVAGVFWEQGRPPLIWALLITFCFVWPWIAFVLALFAEHPAYIERRSVLLDSALSAFWIAAIGFNLLPSVVMLSMLAMNNVATGGMAFVLRGWLAKIVGIAVFVAIFGLSISLYSSPLVVYSSIPMIIIQPLVIGWTLYKLALRLGRNREILRELSETDSLTGLYNRRYWNALLSNEYKRSVYGVSKGCLAILDLDHFKQINDTYGHFVGDEVLRHVACALRSNLRSTDIVARFGGDEFCVFLPDTDRVTAFQVLDRVRIKVADSVFGQKQTTVATLSIGLTAFDNPMLLHEWFKQADIALYEAKTRGRNQVAFYNTAAGALK